MAIGHEDNLPDLRQEYALRFVTPTWGRATLDSAPPSQDQYGTILCLSAFSASLSVLCYGEITTLGQWVPSMSSPPPTFLFDPTKWSIDGGFSQTLMSYHL
jgi:hypothetical protein